MFKQVAVLIFSAITIVDAVSASTLDEIKQSGVIRHLGVKYANFNTGAGDGLDTELMKLFAEHLGVRYQYVEATFSSVIEDLNGKKSEANGTALEAPAQGIPKGDIIATGLTILPWRQQVIDFSTPVFPSQVWLVASSGSDIQPIVPSGDIKGDIAAVKALLANRALLSKSNTCLDAKLYNLNQPGIRITDFSGSLGELVPAVIKGEAELTLIDVPDALIALEKWGSEIKVIGPVSEFQGMAVGFTKNAPALKAEFENFLTQIKKNGTMKRLVVRYYPLALKFYPDFFADLSE